MKPSTIIKTFTDRYPFVGPAIWILCIQYFITQIVVGRAWSIHYSLAHNTISDLGNTACGLYGGRFVCSPLHGLMNASFIMLGITMATGSFLIYQEFKENRASLVSFSFMAAAGVGTLMVGLFPENTSSVLHTIGAGLPFFIGNLSLLILGLDLRVPIALKVYTLLSGLISLIALVLFVTNHNLGLGTGGMERIVAYPQTIWLIIFGIYISYNHIATRPRRSKPVAGNV
jgi:hypothetical membrane protein